MALKSRNKVSPNFNMSSMTAVSLQFDGMTKTAFAAGAMTASLMFFFILGYCGYLLSGFMRRPASWRLLNSAVALTMFAPLKSAVP